MKFRIVLFILLGIPFFYSSHAGAQNTNEVASIYVISQAYAFTSKDTVDITNSFVSDTSAIVIVNEGSDSLFFTIANIRGEQMCVGEVMREVGMTLDKDITAFSGDFICNIGKVVRGNHFFITAIPESVERYGIALYTLDVVLDGDITLRFITTLTQGKKIQDGS